MTQDKRSEPDDDRGRLPNQFDRYIALPKPTRDFIEDLRPKDLALLRLSIELAESIATTGKFMKWVIVAAGALATAIIALNTAWNHLITVVRGGGG